MENQNTKINEIESIKALNEVSMELLRHKKSDHTKLFVVIIMLIVVNLVQCAILVWLLVRQSSNDDVIETVTTTETITQDTEGEGNNVYQAGENANYVQEGKTEVNDNGETDDSSQNNDNEIQAEGNSTEAQ